MESWPDIVERFGGVVWKTARRLLNNDADAADCFQETFISALAVARRQHVRNWSALLQRLATARALDLLRKRISESRLRTPEPDLDTASAKSFSPAQQAENAEMADHLTQALAKLSDMQADVYCLRHLNDLSYEDIAHELGITTDAVGVALHRAGARLRNLLECVAGKESRGEP